MTRESFGRWIDGCTGAAVAAAVVALVRSQIGWALVFGALALVTQIFHPEFAE